jgi:hypothetical protein
VRSSGPDSVLADEAREGFDASFAHVHLPPGLRWTREAASTLGELFRWHAIGVIRILPTDPSAEAGSVVRTRALHRAASVDPEADRVDLSAELFAEWVTTDEAIGLSSLASPAHASERPVGRTTTIARSVRRLSSGASAAAVRALERWAG